MTAPVPVDPWAALREDIARALRAHEWGAAHPWVTLDADERIYWLGGADAVLAVLRGPVGTAVLNQHAARVLREVGYMPPADIVAQRAKGWVDFHPETYCNRCGQRNVWAWFTPSPVWNAVMRPQGQASEQWGIVCPQCLTELAAELHPNLVWELRPENWPADALERGQDGAT